jgi:streptogramin lyase
MFDTFRSSYRAAKKTKKSNTRLQLEELEGRCLLSSAFGPLGGITTGPDGDIWFLEKDRLGRIDPHSGLIQEFAQGINTGNYPNLAGSSIAEAPDGSIWFLSNHQVTRFTPSANALDTFNLTSGSSPLDSLIVGPDGVVWVLEKQSETYGIARIDPASGNVQDYATGELQPGDPRVNSVPTGIAFGPDGKIWIGILYYGPEVMDPTTGVVQSWTTTYLPPITDPPVASMTTIVPTAVGLNASTSGNFRLSGVIQSQDSITQPVMPWDQPPPSSPPPWYREWATEWYDGAPKIASDGSFWFFVHIPPIAAENGIAGYNPSTGNQMQFQVPGGGPIQLTPGPDGNIWYTYVDGNSDLGNAVYYVGSLNPATGVTESFSIATQSQGPPSSTGNPPAATGTSLSSMVGFDIVSAVASFTPQIPIGSPGSAYQATVDWGDGTISSIVFTVTTNGTYDVVVPGHAYQSAGSYNINVTIGNFDPANPLGDNPITIFSTANIDPFIM